MGGPSDGRVSVNRLIVESTHLLVRNQLYGGWAERDYPIRYLLAGQAGSKATNLMARQNRRYQVIRQTFSKMFHQVGHGSGFGSYYGDVQSSNCADCPDCRCGEGPSFEEARKDFRATVKSKMGGSWYRL